ncbi:hypothetical protein J1N35_031145 [Gossypium stocksii]|uniref:DOG1 domain-containing protein n=1 Tax=Gossypium stocksii TaxID=47602 RepID=A0A9D3ZUK3_9ROSI|nr:hypothetical protein J1N35_031145 [Gossypium stocksii]
MIKGSINNMIDPTLESLKDDELEVICDVINECIQIDERQRPTMKGITSKLRQGINIPPEQATPRLSPTCALENSLLWITGCRPSLYIRLTYALCGSQVEYQLSEIIQGLARGNLGQILATQLKMIHNLHIKTIEEEEKLSSQLAGLQENIADQPIAMVAKRMSWVGESSGDVDHALDEHKSSMANILQEADKLRLSTLKELLAILTPLQAVDFLVASKKLHLCMHKWGKTRDNRHGRR